LVKGKKNSLAGGIWHNKLISIFVRVLQQPKNYFMRYLISLLIISCSFYAYSGTLTESGIKAHACQIELAGKLGVATDSLSTDDIIAQPVVGTSGCSGYVVNSFQILIIANGKTLRMTSTSDHFTDEMLTTIRQIIKTTRLVILNVHCKLPNGQSGILPGLAIKVYQKK
jgi:hypothetical protein